NPGVDGTIHRSSRVANTIPGISRFPCGVLLAQHRIEAVLLDEIRKNSAVEIQRNVTPTRMEINMDQVLSFGSHAVTVKLREASQEHRGPQSNGEDGPESRKRKRSKVEGSPVSQETIRAKFVIGSDGAHSWTRAQLGFHMEGEQTEYVWGVLDIIPLTDFRTSLGHLQDFREGADERLVTVGPISNERFDRSGITPDTILQAAQRIMKPYKLEYKYRDWWTVYQVRLSAQRHTL
ncbi:MAG: hypothetical protein Q9174_007445, partial [Haloplaca sp. 1 TL-2023]